MADEIFNADELAAEHAEATVAETPEQKEQRERDEQGRFVAKTPADDEAEGEKRGDGTVPQGALHAEREKRKASEERERAKDAELTKAREQLDSIAKLREQIASRQPEALPAADDPAAIEHLRTRLAELEQGQSRVTQHIDTEALNRAEQEQLGSVMAKSEDEFRSQQPDYNAAIDHVVQARALELSYYGLSPAQIRQTISEEVMEIVRSAIQQKINPAELGYKIALSRGYRPEAGEGEATPANGAATAALAALANAKDKSKSLGSASGSTPGAINAEAVAAMSGEEFEAIYSTPEGRRMIDNL